MSPLPRLGGPQKAALVLMALDEDVAAEVMRHLDEAELRRLAESTETLQGVSPEVLGPVFEAFGEHAVHLTGVGTALGWLGLKPVQLAQNVHWNAQVIVTEAVEAGRVVKEHIRVQNKHLSGARSCGCALGLGALLRLVRQGFHRFLPSSVRL